jgi:hypothetical protein
VTAPHHTIEAESLKVFRCFFAEGEIGVTLCMRSHISVHRATTKYFSNSFVFKNEIEKEGLPRDSTPDLGAGGPRFKSGRPTKTSRVFSLVYWKLSSLRTDMWKSPTEEVSIRKSFNSKEFAA